MFKFLNKNDKFTDDSSSKHRYVIRASICTGEKVAGYIDETGKFVDIMLIRNEKDLQEFCKRYRIAADMIGTIY